MALQYLNANEALPALLQRVLMHGDVVESRNGRTKELTMQQITLTDPVSHKEITVPGRRVSLPAQIAETMWILAGRNDIEWLSHYLPRAKDFSDDGKTWRGGYGPRLRAAAPGFTEHGDTRETVDQLEHVVSLLRGDPETRRAVFNIYDPSIDNAPGKDIPCNNWVHFLPRGGVLHAHVAIRSNDLFWGWSGINAFEWTALLQVVAGLSGFTPGSITFSISSLHLYEKHWGRASDIVSQAAGAFFDGRQSPRFGFDYRGDISAFDDLVSDWFQIEGQIRKGGLSTALLHQIQTFREPMLRSWLTVLLAWHHDDVQLMKDYRGTALAEAAALSPKRKKPELTVGIDPKMKEALLLADRRAGRRPFTEFAANLHEEKHKAYGNSWKKRGEMLGIMANCARKVDRLGVAGGGDSSADTAIDLLMYMIKYTLWLQETSYNSKVSNGVKMALTEGPEHVAAVNGTLGHLEANSPELSDLSVPDLIARIHREFDRLEHWVEEKRADRIDLVKAIIELTYPLAIRLWNKEQWEKGNATRSFSYEQPELDVSL